MSTSQHPEDAGFDDVLEVDDEPNIDKSSLNDERRNYGLLDGDAAITRLQLQHRIWQLTLPNRLTLAPIPGPESGKVRNVIDIGCGTGAWVLDFAATYPSAQILGVDLKPLQPSSHPKNVRFANADVTAEAAWNHDAPGEAPQQYDLIRSRSIASGISSWSALIGLAYDHLRPGGWIELQEFHLPMRCDDDSMSGTSFERWNKLVVEASAKIGVKLDGGFAQVPGLLKEKGLEQIGRKGLKWAVGPWPKDEKTKEVGRMFRADLSVVLGGLSVSLFTKGLGWERESVEKLWNDVEAEMEQVRMHAYVPIDIVWARKPEDASE